MCMERGVHSIKLLTLSSYVVHWSPWAKAITKLHKSWSSTYLAPFFQIACLLFHLKSSVFFCNKDLPGCLLWRNWLCWSCAGHWHWRWCGEACYCSSWESLIKRWSWPCFLTARRQAEGCSCLSCSFSWVCSAPKYCFRWCLAQPECCCWLGCRTC